MRVCEFRLRRARSKLERLCITFEMAHANSKLHRWEQSLNHSRKAFAMAREVCAARGEVVLAPCDKALFEGFVPITAR